MLRTPLLPIGELQAWTGELAASGVLARDDATPDELQHAVTTDRARLRGRLAGWLHAPTVRDALHVASPDLEASLHYWIDDPGSERGRRVERSLVRYLTRMASRPTPFGLFAGTSIGTIGGDTNLETAPALAYRRHTRVDTAYLSRLIDGLSKDPSVAAHLRFRPNTTLYSSGKRLRYVEWRVNPAPVATNGFQERTHHLVAVDDTPYLRATLERAAAGNGATIESLAAALVDKRVSLAQTTAFVETLIKSQLLLPELSLSLTGDEPFATIARSMRELGAPAAHPLSNVLEAVAEIDADGPGVSPNRYQAIAESLEVLPARIDRGQLFHVELFKPAPHARLGETVIREIAAGAELLRRLSPTGQTPLDRFSAAFSRRYEGRSVPLLEVLDDELGLGFPVRDEARADAEPLLAGLVFPPRSEALVQWGMREATLLRLLNTAIAERRSEIALSPADVDTLASKDALPLGDAFSVMATLSARSPDAIRRGDFQLFVHHVSGPSGAQLLGRFCHGDPMLCERVREHLRAEEACDGGAIFAEVVHLATPRAGNLVARPLLREFEITHMGRSGAPSDRQIPASDLLVSVEDDRVLLHSRRLRRRVVPRLTAAHAFDWDSVGVYRFLGALQSQGMAAALWTWGPLAGAPFLPRVTSGRLVLSLARWRMAKEEIEPLTREFGRSADASLMRAVRRWRASRAVPRVVHVAEFDNLLRVDFDNILSVESFIQLVGQRSAVALEEVFPSDDELTAHAAEGRFTHELIVPFTRTPVPARPAAREDVTDVTGTDRLSVVRTLTPGSEWVYAKLYGGAPTADRVLSGAVGPLVRQALERGWIDQWFFIRYADPEPHLRVRFHGDPAVLNGELLPALHRVFAAEIEAQRIWRAQLDTYEREIERYGGADGMLVAERIFHADSEAALALVELSVRGRLRAPDRWRVALAGTHLLFADLGLDGPQRRRLVEEIRERYRKEHRIAPPQARLISDRFREERERLVALLNAVGMEETAPVDLDPPMRAARGILRRRSSQLLPIAAELRLLSDGGRLTMSPAHLASSYVHMSLVRQLRSAARAQELVIYDFLSRLYADPRISPAVVSSDAH